MGLVDVFGVEEEFSFLVFDMFVDGVEHELDFVVRVVDFVELLDVDGEFFGDVLKGAILIDVFLLGDKLNKLEQKIANG